MADLTPTYYKIKRTGAGGLSQGDQIKMFYNLWKALAAVCNNLDDDTIGGVNYMSLIGTNLNTAMAALKTPNGETV